ncbi:MAG: hypothetical protein GX654_15915 [Desulfatiglans sp.]|nr:hypothetical protein [Desulfatiglans sp.]
MLLLITYDLKKPGQDYSKLYEAIKSEGWWWHHLDSTWIVKTNNGPEHWYNKLSQHLDANDYIFICELKDNYYGFLPNKAWEWLKDAFNR